MRGIREIVQDNLHAHVRATGGITIDKNGNEPSDGYMVSDPTGKSVTITENLTSKILNREMKAVLANCSDDEYCGVHLDASGAWHFEKSHKVDRAIDARRLGRDREQSVIWDVSDKSIITL